MNITIPTEIHLRPKKMTPTIWEGLKELESILNNFRVCGIWKTKNNLNKTADLFTMMPSDWIKIPLADWLADCTNELLEAKILDADADWQLFLSRNSEKVNKQDVEKVMDNIKENNPELSEKVIKEITKVKDKVGQPMKGPVMEQAPELDLTKSSSEMKEDKGWTHINYPELMDQIESMNETITLMEEKVKALNKRNERQKDWIDEYESEISALKFLLKKYL